MSLHNQIKSWIIQQIEGGELRVGDKLPSESELCERFGVSRQTVRIAINNLTKDGWTETRKGVGTFCRMKDRRLTMDLGLICFFSSSYIFPRISRGCDLVAHRGGFHILLNQSEYDLKKEAEILRRLQKRGVDGLIMEPVFDGSGPSNVGIIEEMDKSGIPVVLLDNYFPDGTFTRIAMHDEAGGRLAASHLWSKGHRRIGVLSDTSYLPKKLRRKGAESFLSEAGSPVPEEWKIGFGGPVRSGEARRALDGFLSRGERIPTAFICTSDEEAMELYKAADAHGLKIPGDISVVSFDNSSLAELPGISLTTVDHPGQYMGELATQLLLERIMNPGIESRTTTMIQPRLVERNSVAAI